MGIIGGALVSYNRKAGGALMLTAGALGFITASYFWIIAELLLIAGGILAFRIPNDEKVRAEGKQIQVNLDVIARANSEQ